MWDVCTSHVDYISCDVTSSDHVTSLHIGVVSPRLDEIGDVASTLLVLIPLKVFIVATVLARKFHKKLQNFHWKDAWLYVYVFRLKKLLSGTQTMARRVSSRRFPQKAEKGKVDGSDATTRFPRASCFWETHAFCSRNMGVHVRCTRAKKLVSSDFAKILKVATKKRETCKKTLFTPSSPINATNLYRFCLSDKRLPKITNQCLAIGNHKTAREHLAIVHRQVASIYFQQ